MKTSLLILFAVSTTIVRADLVMIQEWQMLGTKSKVVMSLKGAICRVDHGDKMSMITNTETGDVIVMHHAEKLAIMADGAAAKAAAAQTPKENEPAKPPLVATGQKEKVGDFDCEIYKMEGDVPEYRVWVAKDFPGFDEVMAFKNAHRKLAAAENEPDVPGLPIKTEMKAADGTVHKVNFVSLKETPVDDKIFTPPADYTRKKAGE